MLGRKERGQLELFITGSRRGLIPADHVLVRVDQVLDLNWLCAEVADLYCADNGRPCIDPEVAVRLMLAGFLLGIVHDRRQMREAQVNLAIRWFIGYALYAALPDHSSLTRIRQRWGEDVFRRVFTRVVRQCQLAGLVLVRDPSHRPQPDPGECQHGCTRDAPSRCGRGGPRCGR
jgi:transposase